MNLMGKILTVLILLASVVFLFMSLVIGASHQNWKVMALENKKIAEEQYNLRKQVVDESAKGAAALRAEQVARAYLIAYNTSLLSAAETEKKNAEVSLAAKEKQLSELVNQITTDQKTIKAQDDQIAKLVEKNNSLIDEIAAIRVEVVELTKRNYVLIGLQQRLESRQKELESQNSRLAKVLRWNGLNENSPIDHIVRKGLEGKVTEHNDATGRIAVSIGKDDGLKIGHKLKIFRDGKYVGSADVIQVANNQAIAQMIKNLQQLSVDNGDYVTTQER
jgi:hypothetical protein